MGVGFQRNCGAVLVDRWVGVLLNNLVFISCIDNVNWSL